MEKKVSIIIPIYNVAEYIDECIESAHKQTYRNIEIILVDDGSPDTSGKKCDEWAKKDSRIKVIHKVNGGLSSARNAGLDVATGEYIYFLDGDDYIKNNLLETVVPYMNEGYDMVGFGYSAFYVSGNIKSMPYKKYGEFDLNGEKSKMQFLVQSLANGSIGWEAWTRIFRRNIIEDNDLRFEDNRKIFAEDLYFSLCYCLHTEKILCIEDSLYYYRIRENSIMGQESVKLNVNRINELGKAVQNYYEEHGASTYIINNFAAIHFVIIDNIISGYQKVKQLPLKGLRKHIIEDIDDYEFFRTHLLKVHRMKKLLQPAYSSRLRFAECNNTVKYILDGKYSAAVVRKYVCIIISKVLQSLR